MSSGLLSNGVVVVGSPPRIGAHGHALSWTDDLPVCPLSGVGFSTNQIYREDGIRREEHEFEDCSFHFKFKMHDEDCYLYGVFDGHDGSRAANFAAQRMPAELLLGQLSGKTSDEDIKDLLNQAFIAVEKSFFESIDHIFAEKTTIQLQLPEHYEGLNPFPDVMKKLEELEREISGGTTATVALVYKSKLYTANVGDTRALFCQTDEGGVFKVIQLSVDHSISNEGELNRLSQLGLDVERLKQHRRIGSSDSTRCIGDYHVKGGYKDIEILQLATREPVIADPYVHGSIEIGKRPSFLIIMSDGLYQALQAATNTDRVNIDIARMVAAEFSQQSTLNGVAQAVVDKVVRIHHDAFIGGTPEMKQICQKRGDITLLVRNFNYPLANAINSPTAGGAYHPVSVPFYNPRPNMPPTVTIPPLSTAERVENHSGSGDSTPGTPTAAQTPPRDTLSSTLESTFQETNHTYTSTESSTQSSGEMRFPTRFYNPNKLELDENGRVEAYVDFDEFYDAIKKLTDSQIESLNAETKPKSAYEPITEEVDSLSAPEN
ncbi:TGF-beta-activated kinase 1 and MAP3K7-binding protein 1-like [Crassostrea virginica]